jgi:hypothetical protein
MAGGGLDFRVPFIGMKLRVGGKVTNKDTHAIDISLVPPEERATRQMRGGDVEDVLENAIATVRAVVAEAAAGKDTARCPFRADALRDTSIDAV